MTVSDDDMKRMRETFKGDDKALVRTAKRSAAEAEQQGRHGYALGSQEYADQVLKGRGGKG